MSNAIGIIILCVAIIGGFAASKLSDKPDSELEQAAEAIIKEKTGVEVDFSKDKKKDEDN